MKHLYATRIWAEVILARLRGVVKVSFPLVWYATDFAGMGRKVTGIMARDRPAMACVCELHDIPTF